VVCPEENEKQSEYSPDPPGVILDAEVLGRIIIAPEHIDEETGEIKAAAFKKDELKGEGLSLSRLSFATERELETHADLLSSSREQNKFIGIIQGQVTSIRQIRDDGGTRTFCVIDDGLPDYASHSLIRRSGDQGDGTIRKARNQLMKVFGVYPKAISEVLETKEG